VQGRPAESQFCPSSWRPYAERNQLFIKRGAALPRRLARLKGVMRTGRDRRGLAWVTPSTTEASIAGEQAGPARPRAVPQRAEKGGHWLGGRANRPRLRRGNAYERASQSGQGTAWGAEVCPVQSYLSAATRESTWAGGPVRDRRTATSNGRRVGGEFPADGLGQLSDAPAREGYEGGWLERCPATPTANVGAYGRPCSVSRGGRGRSVVLIHDARRDAAGGSDRKTGRRRSGRRGRNPQGARLL